LENILQSFFGPYWSVALTLIFTVLVICFTLYYSYYGEQEEKDKLKNISCEQLASVIKQNNFQFTDNAQYASSLYLTECIK